MAVTFLISSVIVGNIFSYYIPTFYFKSRDITNSEFKDIFLEYTLTGAIITLCFCIPSLLLMKSKPRVPPSISAQKLNEIPKETICESIKRIMNNKSFICILISYSAINGYYFIYFVTANNYYSIYNIDDRTISYLLCLSNICGLIGSLVLSVLANKSYKRLFIILNTILLVIFIFLTIYFENYYTEDNIYIVYISFALFGTCLIPLYSIILDFASEVTYPVGESISIGMLRSIAHIVGFISTYIIQIFLDQLPNFKCLPNLYCIGLFIISFISLVLLKGT